MGFDQRHEQASDIVEGSTRPQPAPGKVTRTTGFPLVDRGTSCDRGEGTDAECFLPPERRAYLIMTLASAVGTTMANLRDAITDARIDVLTQSSHGWGALAEFLFYAASGPLIAGAVNIVKGMEQYAKYASDVQATLTNASRGLRKTFQGDASVAANAGQGGKARFLQLVRETIKPTSDAILQSASELKDGPLSAITHAFTDGDHSVGHYRGVIDDMLGRFENDRLDVIGEAPIYRMGEPVWIRVAGRRRMVILEDNGLHHLTGTGGPSPRDLTRKKGRDGEDIVVDDDLTDIAVTIYREKTGKEPMELDAEAAVAQGGRAAKAAGRFIAEAFGGGL